MGGSKSHKRDHKRRQEEKKEMKSSQSVKMPEFFQDAAKLDAWITCNLNKIWNEVQERKRQRRTSISKEDTLVKPEMQEDVSSEEEEVEEILEETPEVSVADITQHDSFPARVSSIEEHTSSSKDADYEEEEEQEVGIEVVDGGRQDEEEEEEDSEDEEEEVEDEEEVDEEEEQEMEEDDKESDQEQSDITEANDSEDVTQEALAERSAPSETTESTDTTESEASILTVEDYAEKLLEEIIEEEVEEEMTSIARTCLCMERYNYVQKKICTRMLRKHFRSWREYMRKKKTEVPFIVPGEGLKLDDILTVRPLKAPKIAIFEVATFFLHLMRKSRSANIFFKFVVSCPDRSECEKLSHLSENFTWQSFVPEDECSLSLKKASPMLLESRQVLSNITVSARCLLGPTFREGVKEDPQAMCGADGVIFWLSANERTWHKMQQRFNTIITSTNHYKGIPVSLIVIGEADVEDIKKELNIEEHISEGRISNMSVHKCNKQNFLDSMFSQALSYIFLTCHGKPLVHITSVRNLIIQLMEKTWDKVLDARKFGDLVKTHDSSARRAFDIHNIAFCKLLKVTTSEELLRCTIGAPEFKKFLPKTEAEEDLSTEASYGIMPSYFGTEGYKTYLTNLFLSMQVNFFDTWPPVSPQHFKMDLLKLCTKNFISEEAAEELISMTYCNKVPTHLVDTWFACFENTSWTCFMQKVLKMKLESMDSKLKSSDGQYVLVAVDSEQLVDFPAKVWKDYVVSTGYTETNTTIKRLHSPEMSSLSRKKLKVD